MTEILTGGAGVVLSLIFSYVPQVREWYEKLSGRDKRLVMLAALAFVAAGIYGLACWGVAGRFGLEVGCDRDGVVTLVQAFFSALIANQATYLISPKAETF